MNWIAELTITLLKLGKLAIHPDLNVSFYCNYQLVVSMYR